MTPKFSLPDQILLQACVLRLFPTSETQAAGNIKSPTSECPCAGTVADNGSGGERRYGQPGIDDGSGLRRGVAQELNPSSMQAECEAESSDPISKIKREPQMDADEHGSSKSNRKEPQAWCRISSKVLKSVSICVHWTHRFAFLVHPSPLRFDCGSIL